MCKLIIILLFFITAALLYSEETELRLGNKIEKSCEYNFNYLNCKPKIMCFKEEKDNNLGQELFDNYKTTEKKLKNTLNDIMVPDFMKDNFKLDVDVEGFKKVKVAYIYEPDPHVVNFRVEWDEELRIGAGFKKDFEEIDFEKALYASVDTIFGNNGLLSGFIK